MNTEHRSGVLTCQITCFALLLVTRSLSLSLSLRYRTSRGPLPLSGSGLYVHICRPPGLSGSRPSPRRGAVGMAKRSMWPVCDLISCSVEAMTGWVMGDRRWLDGDSWGRVVLLSQCRKAGMRPVHRDRWQLIFLSPASLSRTVKGGGGEKERERDENWFFFSSHAHCCRYMCRDVLTHAANDGSPRRACCFNLARCCAHQQSPLRSWTVAPRFKPPYPQIYGGHRLGPAFQASCTCRFSAAPYTHVHP